MRNSYSKEFEQEIRNKASEYTTLELISYAKKYFGYNMTKSSMQKYLARRKIRQKGFNENLSRSPSCKKPIGSEWIRNDGMILVKVGEPSVWTYKQRYIYEQHYGKVPKGYKVIFLDQNRNNFDIDNLMAVPSKDSLIAFNKKILSSDKEVTKTGIMVAHLINKINDKKEVKHSEKRIKIQSLG